MLVIGQCHKTMYVSHVFKLLSCYLLVVFNDNAWFVSKNFVTVMIISVIGKKTFLSPNSFCNHTSD